MGFYPGYGYGKSSRPHLFGLVRPSVFRDWLFGISIQTHLRIVWLFAGSHGIEELEPAPWPSYFIRTRPVEVPVFSAAETRLCSRYTERASRPK